MDKIQTLEDFEKALWEENFEAGDELVSPINEDLEECLVDVDEEIIKEWSNLHEEEMIEDLELVQTDPIFQYYQQDDCQEDIKVIEESTTKVCNRRSFEDVTRKDFCICESSPASPRSLLTYYFEFISPNTVSSFDGSDRSSQLQMIFIVVKRAWF